MPDQERPQEAQEFTEEEATELIKELFAEQLQKLGLDPLEGRPLEVGLVDPVLGRRLGEHFRAMTGTDCDWGKIYLCGSCPAGTGQWVEYLQPCNRNGFCRPC